jgi:hypothetical protein
MDVKARRIQIDPRMTERRIPLHQTEGAIIRTRPDPKTEVVLPTRIIERLEPSSNEMCTVVVEVGDFPMILKQK